MEGGAGDDNLFGGVGADTLDGGTGFDTADYTVSSASVQIDLAVGSGTGGDADGDTFIDIERILGSGFADTIIGNALDNDFAGGAGDDILRGGDGADRLDGGLDDDTLEGGLGADTLIGGFGTDRVTYENSNAAVTINLEDELYSGGHADGDSLNSIEEVTGSGFADILIGDGETNRLDGGLGMIS